MISPRPGAACAAALVLLAVVASAAAPALASPGPSIRIVPQRVAIGGQATLLGSHLLPSKFYTLLLVVRNGSHKPIATFVRELAHTDHHGSVRLRFQMPIVTRCGPAAIYLLVPRSARQAHAPVTLTGCTAKPGQKIPPLPPKP